MKICYLVDAASVHVHRWVKYFVDKGYAVHLISLRPFRSNSEDANLSNLDVHQVKWTVPYIKKVSYVVNLFSVFVQVKTLLRKIKPDILHAHYVTDYGLIGALTNFHPFVVSVWGSDVLIAPKKSRISRYEASYTLKKADCITTTAKFMKGYLVKTFGLPQNKIVRIPWGIDLKLFHRGYEKEVRALKKALRMKADASVVLSNRHMDPKYEIESIIDAIPHVLKSNPDATFIFIRGSGSSEFENKMKLKAEKLEVTDNIRFISKLITPREMAIYLNMADVFVSIPKTDQFGGSVMEGMACGRIPIVSNIRAYYQYLKDKVNAFFVDPESPREIAEKIKYCIEHPEIKDCFYAINRKTIEKKEDWNKNARKMEELYKNLLDTHAEFVE